MCRITIRVPLAKLGQDSVDLLRLGAEEALGSEPTQCFVEREFLERKTGHIQPAGLRLNFQRASEPLRYALAQPGHIVCPAFLGIDFGMKIGFLEA